ncbi:hypothetical protein SALBM135S_04515 [Streptomyces alboniger]
MDRSPVGAAVLAAATLAVAVMLLCAVRTRRDLRRAGLPVDRQWVFWGAVADPILPADLLPDPIFLRHRGAARGAAVDAVSLRRACRARRR